MIAVAFALEYESAAFRARFQPRLRVEIWQLGAMGQGSAKVLEAKIAQNRPNLVVSAGFAGALVPDLPIGALVIGENFTTPDLLSKLTLSDKWRRGQLVTVDAIIEKGEEKRALGEKTGGLIADMESEHLAGLCQAAGIGFLSVRCISDTMADDMPVPANVLMNPENGRPEPMTLFKHLITKPGCVPAFNRLVQHAKTAQQELAVGLDELVPQLVRFY